MMTSSHFHCWQLIRNTNVLVGIHGAGLMFIMFAADEVSQIAFMFHYVCITKYSVCV